MSICPDSLNEAFFNNLSENDKSSCIKLFSNVHSMCHIEIITNIIKWCINPTPCWNKFHLFGIFIDIDRKIFGYYPNTFENIVSEFFKKSQSIKGFRREINSVFGKTLDISNNIVLHIFIKFIKFGSQICSCLQTNSTLNDWIFKQIIVNSQNVFNFIPRKYNFSPKKSDQCESIIKARNAKELVDQKYDQRYFLKISKIEYYILKKKEKNNADLNKKFELLLKENDFLQQKCNFLECNLKEKNKNEYTEKFVHYFFSVFVSNDSNLMKNESLCLLLLEEQLKNLCRHLNHHIWDEKIKALAWHEYFHNSNIGYGVYKLMPCFNTVKNYFKDEIQKYYTEITDIEKLEKVLTDYLSNIQKKNLIPKSESNPKIICSLGLDACKITDSKKEEKVEKNDDDVITFRSEIEKIKLQISESLELIPISEISIVQQYIFLKIILNSIEKNVNTFKDINIQKDLLKNVKKACPKKPRKRSIKKHDSELYQERVNKTQYIDILLNNSDFRDISLLEPFHIENDSDNQLFVFVLMPLNFELQPIILHISSSCDGRVHDLEIYKIIKILGKLQSFNFSANFICADGETGLTKYHTQFFEKYIENNIDSLFMDNPIEKLENLIKSIFKNFPNCPPFPVLDPLHAVKTARARLLNDFVYLNKFLEPLIIDEIQSILQLGKTLSDFSHIGKMKDYYAINLFTLENTLKAFDFGETQLLLYLLIYSLFLEAFRNPAIELNTRRLICHIIILFFCKFYKDTHSDIGR